MADYYNVTTNLGDAEIAAALGSGTKLNITHIAFGDGNGSVPTPQKTRTALVREVHRQAINKYERHPTVQNWIVIEAIIPSNIGGFWVREIGVIANGKLISHGSHAPFEKVADSTDISEYRLRFTLNIKDGNVVNIILDQSLIYASQAWVEQFFLKRSDPEFLGNSATAARLLTARAVNFSGAATGVFSYNGAANSTCLLTLANSGVVASTYGNNVTVPAITVNAKGIISSVSNQAIRAASTTQTGIVQLVDDLVTDDGAKAATARQVKLLNDNKLDKSSYGTKAFANFNGVANTFRRSEGILNIINQGDGKYLVTLAQAAPDANYLIDSTVSHSRWDAGSANIDPSFTPTTTQFRLKCMFGGDNTTGSFNPLYMNITVSY